MTQQPATTETLGAIFGEPIHVYTREQAIEDGVLVDARIGDLAEVTAQHVPGGAPVVMTAGLFGLIEKAVGHPRACNDWRGVWHDVLWMSRPALRRAVADMNTAGFRVIITGTGRRRLHTLTVTFDGAALTYALLGED